VGVGALVMHGVIVFGSVTLGLRVGMPDLPFAAVASEITFEVLAIMRFGVMSLLTNSAEELAVVQLQSATLVAAEARSHGGYQPNDPRSDRTPVRLAAVG
jgi:hypothetical protein